MQKLKHLEPCKGLKKFTINDNKNGIHSHKEKGD